MITIIFEYQVAAGKQEAYIQTTREKIKPFWESIGCTAYDIWQVKESDGEPHQHEEQHGHEYDRRPAPPASLISL